MGLDDQTLASESEFNSNSLSIVASQTKPEPKILSVNYLLSLENVGGTSGYC